MESDPAPLVYRRPGATSPASDPGGINPKTPEQVCWLPMRTVNAAGTRDQRSGGRGTNAKVHGKLRIDSFDGFHILEVSADERCMSGAAAEEP